MELGRVGNRRTLRVTMIGIRGIDNFTLHCMGVPDLGES